MSKQFFLILGALWLLVTPIFAGGQSEPKTETVVAEKLPPVVPPQRPEDPPPFTFESDASKMGWWNDVVFYEIYVRSFQDSDGDGVGDFKGMTSRLDYLKDLGIGGIWLMPIMESPNPHGYDVVDYYSVSSVYGTKEDFLEFMAEARKRGIKVIIDLVLNHTSNRHPWFVEASKGPDNPFRDFYRWSKSVENQRGPWGQSPVWHTNPGDDENFYYGVFNFQMPDLNYRHPPVTQEINKIIKYWLTEMKVDGFRLDAVKYLIEDGRRLQDVDENHDWLRNFYTYYKSLNPQAFTVGEVWSSTATVLKYTGDQMDVNFQFDLAGSIIASVQSGSSDKVLDQIDRIASTFPEGQYAPFLTNHDQERLMTLLNGNTDNAKLAGAILLTIPGVPFIYYGEEIGQYGKGNDDNKRRPMQWDGSEFKGFSTRKPYGSGFNQLGSDLNVADQLKDPNSLLSLYKRLISLKKLRPEMRRGKYAPVITNPGQVLSFIRHHEKGDSLVLMNLGRKEIKNFGLTVWNGPFQTGTKARILEGKLSGDMKLSDPEINSTGGFDFWQPLTNLPSKSIFVIALE